MADTLIDFPFGLSQRFPHLLCHQSGIFVLVFREDLLQIAQFLESSLDTRVSLRILVAESLIGAIDETFEIFAAQSLECPMQLVVFRVDGSKDGAHFVRCTLVRPT